MQDHELYRRILGIESPWRVDSVELQLEAGEVHVYLAHPEQTEWPCPECGAACKLHDHQSERQWRAFSNPRMILKRVWVGKSAGVGSDLLSRGQGRGGCEGAGGRSSGACSRSAATFLSMGLRSPRAAVSLRAQPGRREPGGRAKVPAARRPPTTASGSRPAVLSCAAASAAHTFCVS